MRTHVQLRKSLTPASLYVLLLFVPDPAPTAEDQDRILGELADLGVAFARELRAKVAEVKSVEEAERLALAFHRVTRGVRLALALRSRLALDRHEIAQKREARARLQVFDRREQVRAVLAREVRRETEREAADALVAELDRRLKVDSLFESFLEGPVEAVIARIREDLGLAREAARAETEPAARPDNDRGAVMEIPPRDNRGDDYWSPPPLRRSSA